MRPHHAHWPARVPHAISVPATSLWENLATSARRFPDKVALQFLGRSTTYRELAQQVDAMAARLHELGVQRGDRVVLDMQNCPQLVVAHFAILRANAVVVPNTTSPTPMRGLPSSLPIWRPTWRRPAMHCPKRNACNT